MGEKDFNFIWMKIEMAKSNQIQGDFTAKRMKNYSRGDILKSIIIFQLEPSWSLQFSNIFQTWTNVVFTHHGV